MKFRIQGAFAERMLFTSEPHATYFDVVMLPGVSQILNKCGLVKTWDGEPGYAALRGTYVHEAIAMWLRDELDEETLDPNILGYFDAAVSFLNDTGIEPLYVEQTVIGGRDLIFDGPMATDQLYYGGNLDLFGAVNKNYEMVDWKCGQIGGDRYMAQLGAYASALRWTVEQAEKRVRIPGWTLSNVQLKEHGKYKVQSYDESECIALWTKCLDAHIERINE